jgi:hypothetical protein
MNAEAWLLVAVILCTLLYGSTIFALLWSNPKSWAAWMIASSALFIWPLLPFAWGGQLFVAIPLLIKFAIGGRDISKPLSKKAIYWALGATIAFMVIGSIVGMLADTN